MKRLLLLFGLVSCWISGTGQITAPFTESFDSLVIPTGWANTSSNVSAGANWKFSGTPGNPLMSNSPLYQPPVILDHTQNGGGIAWSDGSFPAVADCGLLTDSIDVSGLNSVFLQFYYYSNNVGSPGLGNNELKVHFYDGSQWNNDVFTYSGNGTTWQYAGIDLSSYTISGKVLFEFVVDQTTMTSAFYNDILLDDISVMEVPPCSLPSAFSILELDSSSVEFTYSNTNDSVNYIYGPKGFDQASSSIITGSANNQDTITLTGLTPDFEYDVYLISNCTMSGNGFSDTAGPFRFITECGYQKIKYADNFDQSSQLGNCYNTYFSTSGPSVSIVTFNNPFSAPNHISFSNGASSSTDTALIIGPAIWKLDDLDKQVKFAAYTSSGTTTTIEVGTITSLDDPSTFKAVETFTLTSSYRDYITEYDAASSYNGTDAYIAIRHGASSTFQTVYIDNLEVDSIPSCAPTSIFDFYGSVGGTTVSLDWIPGAGTSWDIQYGIQGFTLGSGTVVNSTDTTEVISGLAANTRYDFYLRDNCGSTNSPYIGPITFLTGCAPVSTPSTLPFFEGFENYSGTVIGDTNICNSNHSFVFRQNTGSGRLRFEAGTAFYKSGTHAATLDRSSFGSENTNFLTFTFDLSNYTTSAGIILDFSFMHHGQETHADDRVWVRGSSSDPWVTLYNLNLNQAATGVYVDVTNLNIVPVLAAAGQSVSSSTEIRFGQVGISTAFNTNFSDGYTFDDISLTAVQCPPVSGLGTSGLVDTAVTMDWLPNAAASSYGVWFGPLGFYQGTTTPAGIGHMVNTTTAGLLVDTLTPNKCYEFLVKSYCTNGDSSVYVGPFSFCTPCSPKFAPYFTDFDSDPTGGEPDCWSSVKIGANAANAQVDVYAFGTPRSTPNHLRLYNWFNNDTTMAITPYFGDLTAGDKRIKFYAKTSSSTPADLYIGTVSNPASPTDFKPIDTVTALTNLFNRFIVSFTTADGYNGTDQYIAILHGESTTFQTVYIDDFEYDFIPTCVEVDDLMVSSVDSIQADVSWTASATATNGYQIEYGTGSLGSATNTRITSTTATANLAGLMDGTDYCFWVRAICAVGDTAAWTGPECFTTSCKAISAPYYQNWDNLSAGNDLGCFRSIEDPTLIFSTFQGITITASSFNNPFSAPNQVEFDNASTSTPLILISPPTNDLTAGDKRVRFRARASSSFSVSEVVVGTMSSTTDATTFNPIDTFVLSNTTPASEYFTEITTANGYNGTDEYFALAHSQNGTFRTFFVDDLWYEEIPACAKPISSDVGTVGVTNAQVYWTDTVSTSTNWVVEYGPCGFTSGTGTMVSSTNDTLLLTGLMPGTSYGFRVAQLCPGGTDTSLFTVEKCFVTECLPFTTPYQEDFDGSSWIADDVDFSATNSVIGACWERTPDNGTSYSWRVRSVPTGSGSTGPNSDYTGGNFLYTEASNGSTGNMTSLVSPLVILSGSNPELTYRYFFYGTSINKMDVELSVNGSSTWTVVSTITGQQQTSATDPWRQDTISLSSYIGDTIQVRFTSTSAGCCAGDMAIDDVYIGDPPSCFAPSGLTATPTGLSSGSLTWDSVGTSASSFEVEYGTGGFTLGTGTRVTTSTPSYSFTGLAQNVCQEVYVRSICGVGDTSVWAGPISVCPTAVICTDSIDQYAVGPIDPQSALFIGWQGGGAGDADVSTTQSSSGTQSMRVTDQGPAGLTDVVAYFDTISTGAWEVSFNMYVETGDGAYFNIQQNHDLTATANQWNAELYFQDNGTVQVQHSAAAVNVGTFNYTQGQWFTMSTIIDLTNDTIWFEENGNSTNLGFRYSAANPGQALQFNGVNFFSGVLTGVPAYDIDFYVDDFCVSPYAYQGCNAPVALASGNVGCDSVELSWTSLSGANNSSIIEYGPTGFTPGSGTFVSYVNSATTINGLTPGTAYDFYVADTCGTNDTSAFAGPETVTTLNGPKPVASFTYNVNGFTVDVDASGSTNGTTYDWDFGDGNSGTGVMTSNTYGSGGTFTITLTVTNGCGTDDTTITVNDISLVENTLARSLTVYPNPAKDVVSISFDNASTSDDVIIRVLDLSGKEVRVYESAADNAAFEQTIDISKLAKGVYMLEISNGSLKANKRLVKH